MFCFHTFRRITLLGGGVIACTVCASIIYIVCEYRNQPSLLAEKMTWDVGDVAIEGALRLQHVFHISNTTPQDLFIDDISTDCGCVVVNVKNKKLDPHSSMELPIDVTIAGPPGKFAKHIRIILTNESRESRDHVVFTITGVISQSTLLYTIPRQINFGSVSLSQSGSRQISREFSIGRYNGETVKIVNIDSMLGDVKFNILGSDENGLLRVELSLTPSVEILNSMEIFESTILVETETITEHKTIPILAVIRGKP